MVAKKMPAKKASAKKTPTKTSAASFRMAEEKSKSKYVTSTYNTLKKKAPIRMSDISGSKRDFQMGYADAVATGSLTVRGQDEPFQLVAEKYAGDMWEKKYGKNTKKKKK